MSQISIRYKNGILVVKTDNDITVIKFRKITTKKINIKKTIDDFISQ